MRGVWFCSVVYIAVLAMGCSRQKPAGAVATSEAQPQVPEFHVDPTTAGSIHGTVRYVGPKPPAKLIDMSEDPSCVQAHHGKAYDEALVVGAKSGLGNAFVYVEKGLEGKRFAVPSTPVIFDQRGCWFRPRLIGIQTKQIFEIVNSDPVTHNIHPMATVNREWNHSQGAGDAPVERQFVKPEIMIPVKCNIHSWMHAYIGVLEHPYFAVSKEDGSFEIGNLPPGSYVLKVWHERLGTQELPVTVTPRGTSDAAFVFHAK
jgi:hypothetical protein